jgi:hypothetical protein
MRYLPSRLAAGAQLLACSVLLAGATLATPVVAQSNGDRTCRSALGENFTVSSGPHHQRCCLVVAEKPWYEAKGVVLGKVYLTADNRKVRPRLCASDANTGAAPAETPETPHSLLTPGDGDVPTRFRDIYY